MRLTKRQLKRIIREEYSRLKRRGLIRESVYEGDPSHIRKMLQGQDPAFVDHIMDTIEHAAESEMEGQDDMAFQMCMDELKAMGVPDNIRNMAAEYIAVKSVPPYEDESDMGYDRY